MRKLVVIAIACVMTMSCLALVGCGKEVSGTCNSVVDQCQTFVKGDQVTVKVSGRATYSSDPKEGNFTMTDSGNYSGKRVHVELSSKETGALVNGQVTVKGKLKPEYTNEDDIYITNASLV